MQWIARNLLVRIDSKSRCLKDEMKINKMGGLEFLEDMAMDRAV